MITGSNGRVFDGLKADREAMSTEGIENGARFNEIDTDTRYRFDGENQQWCEEKDGPTDEQVADAVGDWLDENVDPTTGYLLDRTLQQSNAAAPADLVGDLKSALSDSSSLEYSSLPYVIETSGKIVKYADGTLANASGAGVSNYIDLSDYSIIAYKRTGTTGSSASAGMAFYNSSQVYVSGIQSALSQQSTGYVADLYVVKVPANAKYARFTVYTNIGTDGAFAIYGLRKNSTFSVNRLNNSTEYSEIYKSALKSINYGYRETYCNPAITGSTAATCIGIEQYNEIIRLNGTNTSGSPVKIKITNGLARTEEDSTVRTWTGIDLIVGHTYQIVSTLLSGTATFPDGAGYTGIPVSAYYNNSSASIGITEINANGQITRTFNAYNQNVTLALVIPENTVFDNAVFSIILTDITGKAEFLETAKTVRLFTAPNDVRDVGQSLAVVDGCLYIYNSYPEDSPKIRKIDLVNNTDNSYNLDLGHGNGMAYYDGYLYVCGMEADGVIYKVDVSNMTIEESIVYTGSGSSPVTTSGIAYNYATGKFILKVSGGFHIVSTSFVFESAINRKYISTATGQGISCDNEFIYAIESSPNAIQIYDYNGNYYGRVAIGNDDEPENVYNDGQGGWYMITNVPYYGYYVDAVQFYRELGIDNIASVAKLFGKLDY